MSASGYAQAGQAMLRDSSALARLHVADIAAKLNEQDDDAAVDAIVESLPAAKVVELLDHPEFAGATRVLERLPADKAGALVSEMSADRAADVLEAMGARVRNHLLAALDGETRAAIAKLLTYEPGTAGSLMTTEFVSVPASWTIQQTLDHIRAVEGSRETVYAIYVVDPASGRLVGAVSLRRLISGAPDDNVLAVRRGHDVITTSALADREEVARLFTKYDLLAVPVIDDAGHLIGIVTVDDILDAVIEESTEDVQKFGGMEALDAPYMQIGFFQMLKKRAGWLCILFLGEMFTASAMQGFEDQLERAIVLTLFIPLIMSSGGNSGSQATSLIIRALALHEIRLRDWWRVALRELPAGLTLGAILGLLGVIRITIWQTMGFHDYGEYWMLVAATIGCALVAIVTFGSVLGSMLPFVLSRLGFDPASASAPFVATFIDVTGLILYFSIATLILSGTLL